MTAPTAPSPCLGEREAVARTEEVCSSCGLTIEECSERGILGLDAKEALQADEYVWSVLKANYHRIHAAAFEQGYLAGRAKFEHLLTENETLRAERDAARELAGLTWTAPDVDAWGRFAEEKGAAGIHDRLNRLFRRAATAEDQVRQLHNEADREGHDTFAVVTDERDDALSEATTLRAELAQAKAQVAGMREALSAAETRFSDIAAGRAFQPRLHAATGAAEAKAALTNSELSHGE